MIISANPSHHTRHIKHIRVYMFRCSRRMDEFWFVVSYTTQTQTNIYTAYVYVCASVQNSNAAQSLRRWMYVYMFGKTLHQLNFIYRCAQWATKANQSKAAQPHSGKWKARSNWAKERISDWRYIVNGIAAERFACYWWLDWLAGCCCCGFCLSNVF